MEDINLKMIFDGYNSLSKKIDSMQEVLDTQQCLIRCNQEKCKILQEKLDLFSEIEEKEEENLEEKHENWIDENIQNILVEIEEEGMCKENAIQCFSEAIFSLCFNLGICPRNFDLLSQIMKHEYLKIWKEHK